MASESVLGIVIVAWIAMIGLAAYVANRRETPEGEAMLIAAIFGPLGVLVVCFLPPVKSGTQDDGKVSSMPTAQASTPVKHQPFISTDADIVDMIDWSKVQTPEDETRERTAARVKYVSMFGPKVTNISRTNGKINFDCPCGYHVVAVNQQAGLVAVCPGCRSHLLVP